jgi:hypothetical protein
VSGDLRWRSGEGVSIEVDGAEATSTRRTGLRQRGRRALTDCPDRLVEHRLQSLLGEGRAFEVLHRLSKATRGLHISAVPARSRHVSAVPAPMAISPLGPICGQTHATQTPHRVPALRDSFRHSRTPTLPHFRRTHLRRLDIRCHRRALPIISTSHHAPDARTT